MDLDLRAGETAVLLGQSGCGKSTLLRILMGLVRPDTGSVRLAGTSITAVNGEELRRRMGYVIQDGGLFPHLSGEDNVLLLARHLGREAEARAYLRELLTLTKLPHDCLERYPCQLSGGQRQRVSLLRALVLKPEIVLLDEPLGALDPMIRSELQEDLRRVFRALGQAVLLVTHDLGEAEFFGDTVLLMRGGRVVQRGPFDDLLTRPADSFVTRFVQAQRVARASLATPGAHSGCEEVA
jgi:osmoprotectant transport system ATP-binding protein